jgi:hypothetical protein
VAAEPPAGRGKETVMIDVFARGGALPEVASAGLIDLQDTARWKAVNEAAFLFSHRLADHPLFAIDRLAELAGHAFERPDFGRYFRPDEMGLPRTELKRRLAEGIRSVASNGRWISLHFIDEMDPAYAELYQSLLADIEQLTGVPVRRRMAWGSMSVFLNAPGLVVPYHFDHETNFLMQVKGEKEVRLYPRGLATLSLAEIEEFYHFNPLAGRFREELAGAGEAFHLKPGLGVHHPPLAPHMVRNGEQVSVSVAIYYVMPEMEDQARVHQVNYCMRKLGLHPRPPGRSAFWDRVKSGAMQRLCKADPRTHDEMLYSGIQRLRAPFALARTLKQRLQRPAAPPRGGAA